MEHGKGCLVGNAYQTHNCLLSFELSAIIIGEKLSREINSCILFRWPLVWVCSLCCVRNASCYKPKQGRMKSNALKRGWGWNTGLKMVVGRITRKDGCGSIWGTAHPSLGCRDIHSPLEATEDLSMKNRLKITFPFASKWGCLKRLHYLACPELIHSTLLYVFCCTSIQTSINGNKRTKMKIL